MAGIAVQLHGDMLPALLHPDGSSGGGLVRKSRGKQYQGENVHNNFFSQVVVPPPLLNAQDECFQSLNGDRFRHT